MRTARRGLALSCALLTALAGPALASAEPTSGQSARIEVAAKLGPTDNQSLLDAGLAAAVREGMGAAGVTVDTRAPTRVVVEVAWEDERKIDYVGTIAVRAVDDPKAAPLATRAFECEMCGTDDLWALTETEVAAALGTVSWPEPEPEPEPAGTEVTPPLQAAPTQAKPKLELHALGYAGIGVASVGVAAAVAGAVLWSRDDRIELRPDDLDGPVWKRSYRPPGIALVASGLGAVLVGGTLIVVDLVRKNGPGTQESSPPPSARKSLRVQPLLGRGFAGLHVGGVF